MHDTHAHQRIAKLEARLDWLAATLAIEAASPLRHERIDGVGTTLMLDENLLDAGKFDAVIEITTGSLQNSKYAATIENRDAKVWVDSTPIWGIDLAGSSSLTAGDKYPAIIVRDAFGKAVNEVGGPFCVSLVKNNIGNLLTAATKWLAVVGSITPAAWNSGTAYVEGNLVSSGGSDYICILAHTNQAPPNSTYWVLVSLTNQGAYSSQVSYSAAGDYVQEVLPLFAFRSAAAGSGIASINDVTTASQTIGLGTVGTDINITTTAAAYSAGVTYSSGMIASSGGSTYRYVNATPTAGNAPPNATYWVDVTGDAMTILNVPDASTTSDGIITTGTQTIAGFKTFATAFGTRFTDGSGNNGYIELSDADVDGAAFNYSLSGDKLVIYATSDSVRQTLATMRTGSQFATWNNATAYVVGDKVNYSGYGYNCLVNNTNKLPSINPTEWELLPSSYPDTDRPRITLSGGNITDASSTTAGSKPAFEIEDAGTTHRGQTGTGGGGDSVVGGIVTALGSAPTSATLGYTPGNSADWSGDPADAAAALNRLAAAVAGLLGTPVP